MKKIFMIMAMGAFGIMLLNSCKEEITPAPGVGSEESRIVVKDDEGATIDTSMPVNVSSSGRTGKIIVESPSEWIAVSSNANVVKILEYTKTEISYEIVQNDAFGAKLEYIEVRNFVDPNKRIVFRQEGTTFYLSQSNIAVPITAGGTSKPIAVITENSNTSWDATFDNPADGTNFEIIKIGTELTVKAKTTYNPAQMGGTVNIGGKDWAKYNLTSPGNFPRESRNAVISVKSGNNVRKINVRQGDPVTGFYYTWCDNADGSFTYMDPDNVPAIYPSIPTQFVGETAKQTPCPAGWATPTKTDLENLAATGSEYAAKLKDPELPVDGRWFGPDAKIAKWAKRDQVNAVFFPFSGFFGALEHSLFGTTGYYWTVHQADGLNTNAQRFIMTFNTIYFNSGSKSYQFSVRCVKQ